MSLIRHQQAGLVIFGAREFEERIVAGYYYGSLVQADLFHRQNTTLTHDEWSTEIKKDISDVIESFS